MKNLKRVLSLALSGIMLVGMMAMSASAVNAEDFTDSDEITHTEAVSISTALKIIDGQEDGSFNPNGNVTRGQMAKMITRAMFGGEDPVLGVKTEPTFTDIKGRWDEQYIEYCASNGIINGRGDGTFDPEGNVTGTEAAKMLLSALGYRADIYGLTGPDWAISTNSIANRTDVALYGDLKGLDPNAAFTRDQVAQMIYNALNAETMEMKPGMEITNGNVTYNYEPSGMTLLYDKYGAVRVEGVVTANEFSSTSDNMDGKTTITFSNDEELDTMLKGDVGEGATIEVPSGKAEFGKAVAVYVKPSSSTKTNLNKATAISDIIVDDNDVITRTGELTGTAKNVKSWVEKEGFELANTVTYYENYAKSETLGATSQNENAGDAEFIAIDNDGDGEIEVVLKNTYAFGQVSKWDTKNEKVTVKTTDTANKALVPSNEDMDNVVAYEDIAVDDYVNVTLVAGVYYIEAAEVVEGNLDAFNETEITVDGEKYTMAADGRAYTDGLDVMSDIAKNGVLDEAVTIYLNAFGYAVSGTTEAATDYLFVANTSWNNVASSLTSGTLNAFVYMEDGTSAGYVVNKIDGTKAAKGDEDDILGGVYKYSVTSDGKLNLTTATLVNGTDATAVNYTKGQSTLKVDDDKSTLVTTNTIVFLVTLDTKLGGDDGNTPVPAGTIDKVNVYTGKTAPSMSIPAADAKDALVGNDGFQPGVAWVVTEGTETQSDVVVFAYTETAATGDWLYLINWVGNTSKGATFNAIVDGELVEITTNDKGNSKLTAGAYEYEMDDTLYAVGDPYSPVVSEKAVEYIDNTSIIVDGTEYEITKDTVTALLDDEDTDVGATVSKGDKVTVVANKDKEALGIFIVEEAKDEETVAVTDIELEKTSISFDSADAAAQEVTVTVKPDNATDKTFTAEVTNDGDDPFVTATVGDGKVTIALTTAGKTAGAAKEATVTVKAGDVEKTIAVTIAEIS